MSRVSPTLWRNASYFLLSARCACQTRPFLPNGCNRRKKLLQLVLLLYTSYCFNYKYLADPFYGDQLCSGPFNYIRSYLVPEFLNKGWVIHKNKNSSMTQPFRPMKGYYQQTNLNLHQAKCMKKITPKRATMFLMISGILFSCSKKDNNAPDCKINMVSLSGSYKLTAVQYKSSPTAAPLDYLPFMDACEKDDLLILKSDGAYDYNDAGTVCTPSGTDHGRWQVTGNTLTSDGTLNGTVASYDCKTMVYYVENSLQPGDRFTFTMERQ